MQRLQWAATEAIDLIVFPEAFLLGHSYDLTTIRLRAGHASDFALTALCRRVAAYSTTLVVGAFVSVDGRIFNRALVIERGRIIGHFAKAHPNEPGVTAGEDFPTFVRSGVRFGINICNDANHADAAERLAEQQARLILYPLNNMLPPETAGRWRTKSLANLVDRARQTGCWVVSSDVTGACDDRLSYSCTAIVAPDGRIVARVPELVEGAVVFSLPDVEVATDQIVG
ncbi:hypothetical protein ASG67_03585 [Sphingomonas sp. Leaf339]|nr:hypothetical protein ASG67_03585 [Sphingomonas sp. Leaf339]